MFGANPRVIRPLMSALAVLTFFVLLPFDSGAQTLVPRRSIWKYLADGTDQGTFWTQPGFDDSTWRSGFGPLGFNDPHIATPLAFGHITYYFRHTFNVADPAAIPGLKVQLMRDDGAVVYLNGVELFRSNMPSGPVTFNTLASAAVGGADETNYFERSVSSALLTAGANLLAVEVHQSAVSSSDLGFDLVLLVGEPVENTPPIANGQSVTTTRNTPVPITLTGSDADGDPLSYSVVSGPSQGALTGTPPDLTYTPGVDFVGADSFTFIVNDGTADSLPALVTIQVQDTPPPSPGLIPLGAIWKYFYQGSDPGADWFHPSFDDSPWLSGPAELGFGDGDEATAIGTAGFVTAYFRHTFNVSDVSTIPGLRLDLYRDDGAVVYLNGVEVLRNNLPLGPITYSTLAANAGDDGNTAVSVHLNAGLLVNGANVLAVEVHQVNVSSSDLSFDLFLDSEAPPPNRPPTANDLFAVVTANSSVAITLSGSDPDGDPLTFSVVSSPSHGSLAGTAPDLIYTPAQDYVGGDSFQFKVNDGSLDSAAATVTIAVQAPADPPNLLSALGSCDGTEVTVTFDEPVEPVTATDLFHYLIIDPSGESFAISGATMGADQRSVVLQIDPFRQLTPGVDYTLRVLFVCDLDFNCASDPQAVPIQFDTAAPAVNCSVVINNIWPPNKRMVDIGLTASSTDGNLQVQVYCDEPQSAFGSDAQLANGTLKLRACRADESDGRVYLIVVTSADACGNVGVCCTTVVVPANNSAAAHASVQAQAAEAQANCSVSGAPTTPYRLLP